MVSALQPLKAEPPILVQFDKSILVSPLQSRKAASPIALIVLLIVELLQPATIVSVDFSIIAFNPLSSYTLFDSDTSILSKAVHSEKARASILVTLSGITTLVSPLQ